MFFLKIRLLSCALIMLSTGARKSHAEIDALEKAKRLVLDLDASTGTVGYPPGVGGREKEPATCNEIMAKSLVVANEEKAALLDEKETVVKAAALLAKKIEDLESKLEQAQADIDSYIELKQTMDAKKSEDARSHNEALSDLAKLHSKELEKIEAERNKTREKALEDMRVLREDHEKELALVKSKSVEKSAKNLQQLNEQTRRHERDLEELKSKQQAELDALVSKSNSDLVALQEKHAAEKTRSNDAMEALKMSASSRMSNMEAELAAKLTAKEGELSAKLAEYEENLRHAQDEANSAVEEARRNAQELVTSINTKAEAAKNKVTRECHEEILDMKAQFERKEQQLKAAVMDEKFLSEELRSEMQAKVELAQKLHADEIETLNKHQETLRSQLESARIQDEQKMNELTIWKEMHDSQGYCNVTLMADDARQMLEKARDSSERSLSASKQLALKYLQRQFELLQDIRVTCLATYARVSGQMQSFIDEEMAPKISDLAQGAHSRAIAAYDHALPIYEEHVSPVVLPVYNDYVLPVYKENILPLYNEKVAPAAKPIQKKVKAVLVESEKQLKLARSQAATMVEQFARRLEQHKVDQLLPGWLFKHISNLDGTKTITNLFAFCVFVLCITCRRLILGIAFLPFRVVWFFCPLRLLFRTRSKPDSTVAKLKVNGSNGHQKKKSYKAKIE